MICRFGNASTALACTDTTCGQAQIALTASPDTNGGFLSYAVDIKVTLDGATTHAVNLMTS